MDEVIIKGRKAKEASWFLAMASTADKNKVLGHVAESLGGVLISPPELMRFSFGVKGGAVK